MCYEEFNYSYILNIGTDVDARGIVSAIININTETANNVVSERFSLSPPRQGIRKEKEPNMLRTAVGTSM